MRFTVENSPKQCRQRLRETLDNSLTVLLPAAYERFTGFVAGPLFAVRYQSGEEAGRRFYPVFTKAVGFITGRDSATVRYLIFPGLTNPLSLLFLFAGTFFIAFFVWRQFCTCLILAAIWTALVAGTTLVATLLSDSGEENAERLGHYIASITQNDPKCGGMPR